MKPRELVSYVLLFSGCGAILAAGLGVLISVVADACRRRDLTVYRRYDAATTDRRRRLRAMQRNNVVPFGARR